MKRAFEQINGREGETATFFWRCPFTFSLRVAGFALTSSQSFGSYAM
jgi:hypothetical protein